MKVKVGSLTLERARLRGGVWLSDADIAGNLEYENVQLTADDKGCALFAYRLNVAGNLTFRELQAEGTVLLSGAQIGGSLICNGGRVIAAFTDGSALRGDKMKVGEDVYIDDGFTARGTVNLAGTEICGDLDCGRVQLAVLSGQKALDAAGLRVEGELRWRTASAVAGIVDLEHARAGRVNDVTGHWPEDGRLRLQGFTYLGFSDMRHPDICERLEWVRGSGLGFAPQPYRQLAQVYRQAGMEKEARQVAIAQRNDQRRDPDLLPLPSRIGSWLLDKTIKHGYQPLRAVGFLAVLYLAMLLMFWAAQHHDGIIVPSGTTRATATVCNPRYPCFYPAGYAFDTVVPIISLGQASSWRIDAAAPWGWAYTTASWTATGLGWVFATLAAAGFTGLIRKE